MDDDSFLDAELDRYISYISEALTRREDWLAEAQRILISLGEDPDELEKDSAREQADIKVEADLNSGKNIMAVVYEHPLALGVQTLWSLANYHADLYIALNGGGLLSEEDEQILLKDGYSTQQVEELKTYLETMQRTNTPEQAEDRS
jgi:hypothetical protein